MLRLLGRLFPPRAALLFQARPWLELGSGSIISVRNAYRMIFTSSIFVPEDGMSMRGSTACHWAVAFVAIVGER